MAYTPASGVTTAASIVHDASVWYDRSALDNVKKALRFNTLCTPKRLPGKSGLVAQMFRYIPFAANTTAGSEGTVGTGIVPTSETVSATVLQYFDFVNFSDIYEETIIDDSITSVAEELGYRAGLTVDTLIRVEFDSGSATTSSAMVGANLTANDYRKSVMLLAGADVGPAEGSAYLSLAHPYVLYDLTSENSAGGWLDVNKYTDANVKKLFEGDELGSIANVRIGKSTNVGTSGTAATTKYWVYVVGKGAVAAVNLADGQVAGGANPAVAVLKHGKDKADPAGVIAGSCSYNFKFVAKRLKTTNDVERYKQSPADSSVAS